MENFIFEFMREEHMRTWEPKDLNWDGHSKSSCLASLQLLDLQDLFIYFEEQHLYILKNEGKEVCDGS